MASKDFQDLMDLLFKKKLRIQKITVSPYSDGAGHSDISFVGSTDTFSSTEPDVVNYALHIRQTVDSDGNYELVAYKDLAACRRERSSGQASRSVSACVLPGMG